MEEKRNSAIMELAIALGEMAERANEAEKSEVAKAESENRWYSYYQTASEKLEKANEENKLLRVQLEKANEVIQQLKGSTAPAVEEIEEGEQNNE